MVNDLMRKGMQVVVKKNPVVTQLKTNYKEFETQFKNWLAKQSLPVEVAVETAFAAVVGATSSICYNKFFSHSCPLAGPKSLLFKVRNWAVLTGVHKGIYCVMKKTTGKEDITTSLVAGLGAGVLVSLVTGVRGPNVILAGAFFALLSGGAFKVGGKFSQAQSKDELYNEARGMLSSLAFDLYDKNVRRRMFTDRSLPFVMHGEKRMNNHESKPDKDIVG